MGRRGRQVCPVLVMTPGRDGPELVLRSIYQLTRDGQNVLEGWLQAVARPRIKSLQPSNSSAAVPAVRMACSIWRPWPTRFFFLGDSQANPSPCR